MKVLQKSTSSIFGLGKNPSLQQRSKFYSAFIDPEIFRQIFPTQLPSPRKPVPFLSDTRKQQINLLQKCLEDKPLANAMNALYDDLHREDCTALIVNSRVDIRQELSPEDNYFNAFLAYTALSSNLGLEIMFNDDLPTNIMINSNNRNELLGHQDSYYQSQSRVLKLMPYLVLLNSNSNSNTRTWVKENSEIISKLKSDYSLSFYLLQNVKYDVFFTDGSKIFDQHILLKTDENNVKFLDQFSSRLRYVPHLESLFKTGFNANEANLAIMHLSSLVNSKKDRGFFCLNNDETQLVIINNKHAVHGREGDVEANEINRKSNDILVPSTRNVAVLVGTRISQGVRINTQERQF